MNECPRLWLCVPALLRVEKPLSRSLDPRINHARVPRHNQTAHRDPSFTSLILGAPTPPDRPLLIISLPSLCGAQFGSNPNYLLAVVDSSLATVSPMNDHHVSPHTTSHPRHHYNPPQPPVCLMSIGLELWDRGARWSAFREVLDQSVHLVPSLNTSSQSTRANNCWASRCHSSFRVGRTGGVVAIAPCFVGKVGIIGHVDQDTASSSFKHVCRFAGSALDAWKADRLTWKAEIVRSLAV